MDINTLGLLTPSLQTEQSDAKLADNFDDFLLLLTTQLQNQDPLEPLDPNEFTSQLVQFSSVEQLIAQNARLDSLLALQHSSQVSDAVGYVGKTVEAIGDTATLKDGQLGFKYDLSSDADTVSIVIRNSAGNVVRTIQGEVTVGSHEVVWDGLDDQGVAQPEGAYSFEVTGITEDGESSLLTTTVTGVVDGVSNADGALVITIDGVPYPLADVVAVKDTSPQEDSEPQA